MGNGRRQKPAREEITKKQPWHLFTPVNPLREELAGLPMTAGDSQGGSYFWVFFFLVLLMIYFSCYRGTSVHCRKFGFIYIGFIFTPNQ